MGIHQINLNADYSSRNLGNIFTLEFTGKFIKNAGITNSTEKSAIDFLGTNLLNRPDLKNSISALYPFVGSSSNSHKYNFMNPEDTDTAHRLIFVQDSPEAHSSAGYVLNGNTSSRYALVKGLTGVLNLLNVHLGVYNSAPVTEKINQILAGVQYLSDGAIYIGRNHAGRTLGISGQKDSTNRVFADISYDRTKKGYLAINRTSASSASLWDDGINLSTINTVQIPVVPNPLLDLAIGASYGVTATGVPQLNTFSETTIGTVVIAQGLSSQQNADLYNIIKGFNNILGR